MIYPAFSIVIPLYNKETSIRKTLQSVIRQTYQNFEIVVIDDGSTDRSAESVQAFTDPRIRMISKPNGGVSSARNRGIQEAQNEWIAFLDGDDLWLPNYLENVVKMIQKFDQGQVVLSNWKYSNKVNSKATKIKSGYINYFKENLYHNVYACSSSVCVKKFCFETADMLFNENLFSGEDRLVWDNLAKKFQFVYQAEITAIYQLDTENRACLRFYQKKNLVARKRNYKKNYIAHYSLRKRAEFYERLYDFYQIGHSLLSALLQRNWSIIKFIIKKFGLFSLAYPFFFFYFWTRRTFMCRNNQNFHPSP